MTDNIISGPKYMTRQNAVIIGLICLFIGFIMGVGVTTYKTNRISDQGTGNNKSVDYEKKARELEAQVAQSPENTAAWTELGHVYYDTNQFGKAIGAYKKSLALNPENPDILTDLGIMYRHDSQPEKAIESFDKAISIDQKHETARLNKGIVLMNDLKEREEALEVWEELLEINPIAMADKDQSLDQLIKHYKEHNR